MRGATNRVLALVVVLTVVLAGCAGPEAGAGGSPTATTSQSTDRPTTTPTTTDANDGTTPEMTTETTGANDDTTPEMTTETTGDGGVETSVPVASLTTRLQVGTTEQVSYRGHSVTISYSRSDGTSRIVVETKSNRRTISRRVDAEAGTVSWTWANRRYVVEPVEVESRDGQRVYLGGETWNTSHIEFEIFCVKDC